MFQQLGFHMQPERILRQPPDGLLFERNSRCVVPRKADNDDDSAKFTAEF